jgi:hypothetical protein
MKDGKNTWSRRKKMPKYCVLITCQEYVEVEGENAKDAEWKAYEAFRNGELVVDPALEFVCEEADLIEEEENEL